MIFSMLILVPALADAYLGISPTLSAPSSFRLNRPVFVQNSLPWNLTFRHVSAPTLLEMSDSADMEAPSPSSALFPPIDKNALLSASILAAVPLLLLSQVSPAAIDVLHETTHAVTKIPADAWSTYAAALAAAPVRTKAATSGVVYALGDALSQKMEGREMGETDVWRMARSGAAGFLGHGPLSHLWYGASEGFFQAHPEIFGSWYGVLPKVVVDQTTWGPFWNNVYIVLLGVMCSASPKKILEDIKTTTVPLLGKVTPKVIPTSQNPTSARLITSPLCLHQSLA
uniref:Mitochondrial fission process protein 1 n=1 Tax=Corethron hystrix TaxID=216773 RepID=A0A6U5IW89_9STRA|mmetsp:Transcript_34050/g.78594  ORF Transcript_34050/g.78594 Transcript_34050/m.78594 type:complete len:285 (+) Transcript_34050:370-1224(+)